MEIAVLISIGLLIAVLGVLLGVALGRFVWPALKSSDATALTAAQTEALLLKEEIGTVRRRAEQLEIQLKTAAEEKQQAGESAARWEERSQGWLRQAEEHAKSILSLENERGAAAAEAKAATAEVARLREREAALSKRNRRAGNPACRPTEAFDGRI
jgi:hypothetical protein